MRAFLLAIAGAVLLIILANGLWLARSTAVVRNQGAEPVSLTIVLEDGQHRSTDIGTLGAGEAQFLWIPARGEATLYVAVDGEDGPDQHCGAYVEGAMYHVIITVRVPHEVMCRAVLPLLHRLLVLDLLRAQF